MWKIFERGGVQLLQLFIQIVLARILTPEEFGVLAIVLVFINLGNVLIDGGFSVALVQKKKPDALDYSSILYFSIAISIILYALLFFFSPKIASLYNMEILTIMLRIVGLILPLNAFNSVQQAFVSKNLLFKHSAYSSLIATIISGVIGVYTAIKGFSIWALVFQQVTYSIMNVLILNRIIKFRPLIKFSMDRVSELFGFGSKILLSTLIYRLYLEIRTLIIGRVYNVSALAFYQKGEQIPKVVVNNIDGAIQNVILPVLSEKQDNIESIKSIVRRSLKTSSFLIFPMMIGLAAVSESFIYVVLGEQWMRMTSFLILFCLTYAVWPIITINQQPARAMGRSDIIVRTEIIKRIIGVIIIIVTVNISVKAIVIGYLIERLIEVVINAYPNKILIEYRLIEQLKDILPSFIQSLIMGFIVYLIGFLSIHYFTRLCIQIVIGGLVYIILAIVFKNESLGYLKTIILPIIQKNKK